MKILKEAIAGSVESSDVMITLKPASSNSINITSSVMKQFGKQINDLIESLIKKYDVDGVEVTINDQGALDYVIEARFLAALGRANEDFKIKWEDN